MKSIKIKTKGEGNFLLNEFHAAVKEVAPIKDLLKQVFGIAKVKNPKEPLEVYEIVTSVSKKIKLTNLHYNSDGKTVRIKCIFLLNKDSYGDYAIPFDIEVAYPSTLGNTLNNRACFGVADGDEFSMLHDMVEALLPCYLSMMLMKAYDIEIPNEDEEETTPKKNATGKDMSNILDILEQRISNLKSSAFDLVSDEEDDDENDEYAWLCPHDCDCPCENKDFEDESNDDFTFVKALRKEGYDVEEIDKTEKPSVKPLSIGVGDVSFEIQRGVEYTISTDDKNICIIADMEYADVDTEVEFDVPDGVAYTVNAIGPNTIEVVIPRTTEEDDA